ncbi:MAG: hypothetical protein NT157_03015, partial [Candidatus Micrarchaeota archaeon]|nr:hypothetical protein [Candidatus Micrarchaeota archaeon]
MPIANVSAPSKQETTKLTDISEAGIRRFLGPDCTDALVYAITNSSNPRKSAENMKEALLKLKEYSKSAFPRARGALEWAGPATLFLKYPNELLEIAKYAGEAAYSRHPFEGLEAFDAFEDLDVRASHFEQHRDWFVELARTLKERSVLGFRAVQTLDVWKLFVQDHELVIKAMGNIAKVGGAGYILDTVYMDSEIRSKFIEYCRGKIGLNDLVFAVMSMDPIATEIGRPLDDLHNQPTRREAYLKTLSDTQVFAILASNPEYFFTSSNHLLFDRLKNSLGTGTVSDLFEKYRLFETELGRNFLFRAITYDRLYGRQDSLLSDSGVKNILKTLLAPLSATEFDSGYFFILANCWTKARRAKAIAKPFEKRLESRFSALREERSKSDDENKIFFALDFLLHAPSKPDKKSYFNRENYVVDGKLRILQVFDREETEFHWDLTKKWAEKYCPNPAKGKNGELIYETNEARITLFRGKNGPANQDFIRKKLGENPNLIVSFRGHSFNLSDSFPDEIFGNKGGHILFVPGSCGSFGSIPHYISSNP